MYWFYDLVFNKYLENYYILLWGNRPTFRIISSLSFPFWIFECYVVLCSQKEFDGIVDIKLNYSPTCGFIKSTPDTLTRRGIVRSPKKFNSHMQMRENRICSTIGTLVFMFRQQVTDVHSHKPSFRSEPRWAAVGLERSNIKYLRLMS